MGNLNSSGTIDECRAAALLGLPLPELRWFSRALGLGHQEEMGSAAHTVFTLSDELKRLSSSEAKPPPANNIRRLHPSKFYFSPLRLEIAFFLALSEVCVFALCATRAADAPPGAETRGRFVGAGQKKMARVWLDPEEAGMDDADDCPENQNLSSASFAPVKVRGSAGHRLSTRPCQTVGSLAVKASTLAVPIGMFERSVTTSGVAAICGGKGRVSLDDHEVVIVRTRGLESHVVRTCHHNRILPERIDDDDLAVNVHHA